jgi:hypothetical protein
MSIGHKGLIVDPDCQFSESSASRRKKRTRLFEPDEEEEGQVAAREKGTSICCLVRLRKDYVLYLRSYLSASSPLLALLVVNIVVQCD